MKSSSSSSSLALSPTSPSSSSSPSSTGKPNKEASRVCDSCFNILLHASSTRQQKILKQERDKERAAELEREQHKELLMGSTPQAATKSDKVGSAGVHVAMAAEALAERGERLMDVAEKSEMLKDVRMQRIR